MRHLFIIFLFLLAACKTESPQADQGRDVSKEELIQKHQDRIQTEEDRIDAYIDRRGWNMQVSGSGLRLMITESSSGEQAEQGKTAVVDYRITLLNGRECYSSEEDGAETFVIGKDAVESGLHEGIQYMKKGESAILIMPPHLAHGLLGDREKIPANASLVFELKLLDLK